jgi:hypothetical protein
MLIKCDWVDGLKEDMMDINYLGEQTVELINVFHRGHLVAFSCSSERQDPCSFVGLQLFQSPSEHCLS